MPNENKEAGVILPALVNDDQLAALGIAFAPYIESLKANNAARHINRLIDINIVTSNPLTLELDEPSANLEKELKEVTDLLPQSQRAAYVAGFLRHYDLLPVSIGEKIVYTKNPDEEKPRPGYYVPAALVNRDRTPQ